MTSPRLIFVASSSAASIFGAFALFAFTSTDPVTPANFQRIRKGMTESEVVNMVRSVSRWSRQ